MLSTVLLHGHSNQVHTNFTFMDIAVKCKIEVGKFHDKKFMQDFDLKADIIHCNSDTSIKEI